jgi:hypothetical protein
LTQKLRLLGVRVGTLMKAEDAAALQTLSASTNAVHTTAEEPAPPYTDQLF